MGQAMFKAEKQGVNNLIGQQVINFPGGSTSTTNNQIDNGQKFPQENDYQKQLPPPYGSTPKTISLNPLETSYHSLNRPHDVIKHAGRYVVTDTYNGRIGALSATTKDYLVLYEAKGRYVPFRPFSIVALSDTEDSFLITDLHHHKEKGFVLKLEENELTPFSTTYDDFRTPTGIALNRNKDRVYIADSSYKCILEFHLDGTYLGKRGDKNLTDPWFIACNSQNKIYVTDKEGIKVFDPNWVYLTTVTVDILGKTWCYRGIAIDESDNIFITARSRDSSNLITNETVAAMNVDHKLVKDYTGGIVYHNYLRGLCIDYERNRVVVVNGEKHSIVTYTLH